MNRFSGRIGADFPVIPGRVSASPVIPEHIEKPEYAVTGKPYSAPYNQVFLYHDEERQRMIDAAKLAREMLEFSISLVKPGISTDEIDALTFEEIIKREAYPSPVNYSGFPKSICTSVNEVACHGIPDDREIIEGDIVSIDVSVFKNGYHGDNCMSIIAGQGDEAAEKLVRATEKSMLEGIAVCQPLACLSTVGTTIQRVAHENDFRVVHEFCGHGLGAILHMYPLVKHYANHETLELREGMIFTVEPILCEGNRKITTWDDGWTAATVDGGRAAQFEHEVLVTSNGPEIITKI